MLSDGEMSYLYDGFGRLEQVTKADGSFQKNHYNAEGLRAEMEENGQLVKFLYNENREAVAEEESDGNVIRYIRRLGLISSDSEKAKTYYHYVSDEQGSITHVINGEEKESGELPQEDVQSRVLNHYEYDAFGNTVSCEEQVHNRFRYTGEQYDPLTGQYYLRARYYNPVIARFTQEDTYYGDGLNLYTYCQNNPILNHDPTGHGTKENSPYSRKEQQYIDAGADPDTARLAAECYPDAKSKQDLYNKYKKQGYSAQDAKKLANREIIHGEEATKKYIKDNNVKKSGPDYTATSPRDNVNTDWRTQERLNAQRNAGAGKGNESGNKTSGMLTNAGALLADESPIYCSRLFCTRWNGIDKASGGIDALDDEEYTGSLILLLEEGMSFARRNSKKMWRKESDRRVEYPEYPERSIFEGLVNGLVHRDYLDMGSEVHIDIFDDRLEIYSPGGMYDGTQKIGKRG